MPEVDDVDVVIDPKDIEMSTARSGAWYPLVTRNPPRSQSYRRLESPPLPSPSTLRTPTDRLTDRLTDWRILYGARGGQQAAGW
eukprot:4589277-Pyramimonas_sp.AAC.1